MRRPESGGRGADRAQPTPLGQQGRATFLTHLLKCEARPDGSSVRRL